MFHCTHTHVGNNHFRNGQAIHLHSAYIEYVPLESAAPLSTPLWKDFISIVQYHSCSKKGGGRRAALQQGC